jgi:hypothetical protein
MLAMTGRRALVVMVLAMGGCAGNQPSAGAPSATLLAAISTPGSTPEPSLAAVATPPEATPPGPTCEGGAPTTSFAPDSIVCVTAGPLRLRSRPNTSDASAKFEPLLETGQFLFVIDGPTAGSGYTWYLVHKTPGWIDRADGWVAAAAREGTPWLAPATVSCPADPSLEVLGAIDAMQRIHCYHSREFTFTGTVQAGPMCGDGVVLKSPDWMAQCLSTFYWGQGLVVTVPPSLVDKVGDVDPEVSFTATITAHMDDPAARTCLPDKGFEADYELLNPGTVLMCRTMFVATAFERIANP